jgi:hypothetical protein
MWRMIEEGYELLIVEKKSRIRMNGEEHLRMLSSFVSIGNKVEKEK